MAYIKKVVIPHLSDYMVKAKAAFPGKNAEYKRIYDPYTITNNCCVLCKNAYGGCPWSESGKPIPDWIAAPTTNSTTDGYKILFCPQFEEGSATAEDYDDEGCFRLLERICEDSGNEYRSCCQIVKECRKELKEGISVARNKVLDRYGEALLQMRLIEQFIGSHNAETLRSKCHFEEDPVYDEIAMHHAPQEEEA